jgi:hypothetical protein
MDLPLYGRVLWRFRVLVVAGLLLAVFLAVFSAFRIGIGDGVSVTYRDHETWSSSSTVWVTQSGFPLGRSVYDQYLKVGNSANAPLVPQLSDPNNFSGVAALYATLATSDPVRALMRQSGPIDGTIQATQPTQENNSTVGLPFVNIAAQASTPAAAEALAQRATVALLRFVKSEQDRSNIPTSKRIELRVVDRPDKAFLTGKRSITRPIVVLLATLMVVFGLVFVLENLRPRVRAVAAQPGDVGSPTATRRSA